MLKKLAPLIGLLPLLCFATPSIDRLIVFGDSLSDNGNTFIETNKLHEYFDGVPITPSATLYWHGRFSDGPVWNEFLAGILHFMPEQRMSDERQSPHYQNFAYGGAWAEIYQPDTLTHHSPLKDSWHTFPPAFEGQVDNYLDQTESNIAVRQNDLIFIWFGGNDYLNQELSHGIPVARAPDISTQAVLGALQENIERLVEAGCTHFVLLGLPDLGRAPNVILRDPNKHELSPALTALTELHNQKLQKLVATFAQTYPQATWSYFDVNQFFLNEYQEAPVRAEQYQKTHAGHAQKVSTPCLLAKNDPDPLLPTLLRNNPVLAMTLSSAHTLSDNGPYRFCDLHTQEDQASPYHYNDAYDAGGIFFDHIHPLTELHAKLALHLCHHLTALGYQFYDPESSRYLLPNCDSWDNQRLILSIVEPPFPKQGNISM